jgi:hypothetical protein
MLHWILWVVITTETSYGGHVSSATVATYDDKIACMEAGKSVMAIGPPGDTKFVCTLDATVRP